MSNGKLILVRGAPGAGKTSLAISLCDALDIEIETGVIEADDYFYRGQEYKFDASKLQEAHEHCINRAREFMETSSSIKKRHILFVSNTFTREWEMQPYFDLAKEFGWKVHSIVVENRHAGRSIHGVPDKKVKEMKSRFEINL
jgi:adenylate kinase family enzyme